MRQVILYILCEGYTEERFASKVLKAHLKGYGIVVKPVILITNRKKNIRGGLLNYQHVKNDLEPLVKHSPKKSYEKHFFTTMFDFYHLPNDFPGYGDAMKIHDCYGKVRKLEENFKQDIWTDSASFIPYIQLHEFEALVFCGLEHLLSDYPDMTKQIDSLKKVVENFDNNPERINDNPDTAPSKRIIKAFESHNQHYNKIESGLSVTSKVGIEKLKDNCPHFREWIEKLENFSEK